MKEQSEILRSYLCQPQIPKSEISVAESLNMIVLTYS